MAGHSTSSVNLLPSRHTHTFVACVLRTHMSLPPSAFSAVAIPVIGYVD